MYLLQLKLDQIPLAQNVSTESCLSKNQNRFVDVLMDRYKCCFLLQKLEASRTTVIHYPQGVTLAWSKAHPILPEML